MKQFVKKCVLLVVLVAGVLASRTLFNHNNYFIMHDDLQMMRQLELEKCFLDLQIPCRWVPDMGYGFGFPLFNYYPQLPYLVGEIFRVFTLPFNDVAKLTFALGIIASGFSMYFLSKEFFGKSGGLLSSIFYIWAPYRAVDVYVRGAMNESWAWIFFPLILLFSYRLIANKTNLIRNIIFLSLSISALLLTHNLMVLIFAPVALTWVLFWIFAKKSFKPFLYIGFSGVTAIGLSAFFTLPALLEQNLVHIDTLTSDYFQFAGHFTTLSQLFFSRDWGDGPSIFGPYDTIAFPIGQVHWIVVGIVSLLLLIKLLKTKKFSSKELIIVFGILVGTFAAFMSHERSAFVWTRLEVVKFLQFPWRFLTLNVFGYSFAIGGLFYLVSRIKIIQKGKARFFNNVQFFCGILMAALVIVFNWKYFAPVRSGPLVDSQKFSGEAWRIQKQAGIRDYLPITASDDPEFARERLVDFVKGKGEISEEKTGTNWASFKVASNETSTIRINIFDFPEWKVFVDDLEKETFIPNDEKFGRMYMDLPEGNHSVYLKLHNTNVRNIANTISLVSWISLLGFLIWRKRSNI